MLSECPQLLEGRKEEIELLKPDNKSYNKVTDTIRHHPPLLAFIWCFIQFVIDGKKQIIEGNLYLNSVFIFFCLTGFALNIKCLFSQCMWPLLFDESVVCIIIPNQSCYYIVIVYECYITFASSFYLLLFCAYIIV